MPETSSEQGAVDAARANGRPPRDDLVRAVPTSPTLRAAPEPADPTMTGEPGGMPVLTGRFSVFNEWTEIDSFHEGRFLERIAPGAFKKTFRELGARTKVLFQHGMDPQVGDKVLGRAEILREDDDGAYYEVPLLDTSYNRDLIPGLRAGLYGASFRFSVVREDYNDRADISEHNPHGLPERTIKEARVPEFGPVTFPAYAGATAGLRSLTDEFLVARMTSNPDRLRAVLGYLAERDRRTARAHAPDAPDVPDAPDMPEPAPVEERPAPGQPDPSGDPASPHVTPSADPNQPGDGPEHNPDSTESSPDPVEPADETRAEPEAHPDPDGTTAPPLGRAEPLFAHPAHGRRTTGTALYGHESKEHPWLLT